MIEIRNCSVDLPQRSVGDIFAARLLMVIVTDEQVELILIHFSGSIGTPILRHTCTVVHVHTNGHNGAQRHTYTTTQTVAVATTAPEPSGASSSHSPSKSPTCSSHSCPGGPCRGRGRRWLRVHVDGIVGQQLRLRVRDVGQQQGEPIQRVTNAMACSPPTAAGMSGGRPNPV